MYVSATIPGAMWTVPSIWVNAMYPVKHAMDHHMMNVQNAPIWHISILEYVLVENFGKGQNEINTLVLDL